MSRYTIIGLALGLLVFVTAVVLGFVYTFSQPIIYEATARIWVQPKLAEMVPSSYQTSLYAPLTAFFNSPITTAGEVLRSDVVLGQAHKLLAKELPPEECPSLGDLRGVSVSPVSNADILILKYRSKEPKICKASLDAVLRAFMRANSAQSAQSATQSRIFLEKQLFQVKRDNTKARLDLQRFQEDNETPDLDGQTQRTIGRSSELESAIRKAQNSIAELQQRNGYLQSQLKISPEDAMLAQRLNLDEEVKQLKQKVAVDEVRMIDLKTRFKDEHPRVQQLRITIDQSKKVLRDRIKTILGETGAEGVSNLLYAEDPVQQKLLSDMVTTRAEEIAQDATIPRLESELSIVRAKLAAIPKKQVEMAELKRNVDITTQTLSDTERNLHSMLLLESVASKASNIQILDYPEVPMAPVQARTSFGVLVSIVLGLFLGAAAFTGVYFLNPAIQRIGQVLGILPLPIVGWIDQFPSDGKIEEVLPGMQRLRVNLRAWLTGTGRQIVITSGDPEDGKSILGSGLAINLAQSGLRVSLIDVNFQNPQLHKTFSLPESPGLSDYLLHPDNVPVESIIHVANSNLRVVPAGVKKVFSGVLEGQAFARLVSDLRAISDVVIFDCSAASESADALALLNRNVFLLVVVRLRHTYGESLKLLAAQLRHQDMAAGGLVFFGADERAVVSAVSSQTMPDEAATTEQAESEQMTESSRW